MGTSEPEDWLGYGIALLDALVARRAGDPADVTRAHRDAFAASLDGTDSFSVIAANAQLTFEDAEVFALLAAAEIDPVQHHRLAELQGDRSKRRVTIGTLIEALGGLDGHRGILCVGADAPLRRAALVEVFDDGPWSDHIVALHPSVAWALVGDDAPDPGAPTITATVSADDEGGHPLTVVSGDDRRRRLSAAAAATAGANFMVVDAPDDPAGWSALVREATITGMGIIVEIDDELSAAGGRWIERADHLSWAVSARRDVALGELPRRPWRAIVADTAGPTDVEWQEAFGSGVPRSHPLRPEQLDDAARAFHATGRDLDAAVRRLASGRLDHLARRIRPSRGWDDLVLSADRTSVLRTIVDRYVHADQVYDDWGFGSTVSSRGLVSLFSGPSGTGKTLAAEVIAGELGLDLFKIDLSSVVSKYIGETEKNLEQIFDAASAGNMVLFFDEADALFGKRSEVKDARDRYANIEVSYLLQRLEAYEGLIVMATNFEKNVDEAFLRRIHTRIEFALPDVAERTLIWERNVPDAAPVDQLDTSWLGERFEISGGIIRNAVIHAAFLAATRGDAITTADAVVGVAFEFRKLGRLIKPDGFGDYYDLVTARSGAAR